MLRATSTYGGSCKGYNKSGKVKKKHFDDDNNV